MKIEQEALQEKVELADKIQDQELKSFKKQLVKDY